MKYRFITAFTILPLLMSACSSGGEATPEPGEYQQTIKITELDFPGFTEADKAAMTTEMEAVGSAAAGKFCLDGKARGQWKEASSQMAGVMGGHCDTISDKGTATRMDLKMQCGGTANGDVAVTMTGKSFASGYESRMDFDFADPESKATAKLALEFTAKRLGDCAG